MRTTVMGIIPAKSQERNPLKKILATSLWKQSGVAFLFPGIDDTDDDTIFPNDTKTLRYD